MKFLLIFTAFSLPMLLSLDSRASLEKRTYYVSLVEKGAVSQFYNRLTNGKKHVVVTSYPVEKAEVQKKFSVSKDQELLLVEPRSKNPRDIQGMIDQIGGFAIVILPNWGKLQHFHLDEQFSFVAMARRVEQEYLPAQNVHFFDQKSKVREPQFISGVPASQAEELKSLLSEFSGAVEVELNGEAVTLEERGSEEGRERARNWLKKQYEDLGFEVSSHEYKSGINFVAERKGSDTSKVLLVTAHLDSVYNAGADDNGAGTISILSMARSLQNFDLKYTLRIIGFDQEELGLIGSRYYADDLNDVGGFEGLIGVINLEMTAYDGDKDFAFHIIDCEENTSAELTATMESVMEKLDSPLKKVDACTNRSDHASFWTYDQPAIVISQNFFGGDSNPCYHQSCDQIDILDFEYMKHVTDVITSTVAAYVVEPTL